MASAKSRATRSSWPPVRTGSRTKSPPKSRRPPMRNPQNDTGETLTLEKEAHVPERTCVLTRRKAAKEELIRLALSPDCEVAPDVRARAPGRGAWIGGGPPGLDDANAKGKLKAVLQRAFKINDLSVPANLGERTAHALRQT